MFPILEMDLALKSNNFQISLELNSLFIRFIRRALWTTRFNTIGPFSVVVKIEVYKNKSPFIPGLKDKIILVIDELQRIVAKMLLKIFTKYICKFARCKTKQFVSFMND